MKQSLKSIVVFLGPPGIGKGTQAKILTSNPDIVHLSTGDIIRDEVGRNSAIGKLMEEMGWSSPEKLDLLVLDALVERLDKINDKTIILDGCPRSIGQAKALDELLAQRGYKIDRVIEFYGDDEILIKRMSGRFACAVPTCKEIYHDTEKPTLVQNICDKCGSSEFYRRPEDNPEIILKRLNTYRDMTLPVIDYYSQYGLVNRVNGTSAVKDVTETVLKSL